MTNETPYQEGRPPRQWPRWLVRSRTPWLLGTLTLAVVLVVRSAVEQEPQALRAMEADVSTVAAVSPPMSRTGAPVARVDTGRRNRGIERDFFVGEHLISTGDRTESPEPVPRPSPRANAASDDVTQGALSGLVLHAIVMGETPKAFLNDRFVGVGGELDLEGARDIVLEVKAITEESVVLVSGKTSVVLRLVPSPTR